MKKLPIRVGDFFLDHFHGGGSHPYFGVWEIRGTVFDLVCVCLYRRGAEEVLRRMTEPKPQMQKDGEGGIT
jgi:hypothetical protein